MRSSSFKGEQVVSIEHGWFMHEEEFRRYATPKFEEAIKKLEIASKPVEVLSPPQPEHEVTRAEGFPSG